LHLRLSEEDPSYNYLRDQKMFIGRLHTQDIVDDVRQFIHCHQLRLEPVLQESSLEEAGLRAEDSAAFVDSCTKGKAIRLGPHSSAYLLTVGASLPSGSVRAGVFPFDRIDRLGEAVRAMYTEYHGMGARVVEQAENGQYLPPHRPIEQRPWWKLWDRTASEDPERAMCTGIYMDVRGIQL
jgi:hypothetical protein